MAYALPTFNLLFQAKVNYTFAGVGAPVGPFVLANTPCNLAYARRTHGESNPNTDSMYLLFPAGVALKGKDSYVVKNGDAVEVPMGSGRWYSCVFIDRVGAGFANEHQSAILIHPWVNYPTTIYLWPSP